MPRQPRTSANKGKRLSKTTKSRKASQSPAIPYAVGFKPPTETQSRNAIGFGSVSDIPREFNPVVSGSDNGESFKFFNPIPKPSSMDDWLAQYAEEGQTYKQFLTQCPWLSSRKRKFMSQEFIASGKTIQDKYPNGKIYIIPVGDFGKENAKFYASLIEFTEIFLGLPVVSLPNITLEYDDKGNIFWIEEPKDDSKDDSSSSSKVRASTRRKCVKLRTRYNADTEHNQLCVDCNLMQLRKYIPDDAICMIGLTMLDLYGEESDLFVAGMAAGSHRVAIFSLYRYDPCLSFSLENWFEIDEVGKMSKKERERIMLQRGCKLLVHEICHLLGIDHCIYYDCCMNGSGHLQEDFRQAMQLCPVDLHKLATLVGFNVLDRYTKLLAFYKKQAFKEEASWVDKRIQSLS